MQQHPDDARRYGLHRHGRGARLCRAGAVEVAFIRKERIVFSSRTIFSKLASTSKAGWPCCTRICYWVCAWSDLK